MKLKLLSLGALTLVSLCSAHAGIVIGGTRVIYDGSSKETSINVSNPDEKPYLIQSWIDTDNGIREGIPFIVTPPLFRLDGTQQNMLRILRTGGNLPENEESIYWLNIKSIPSSPPKQASQNTLQIAIKTRIKLIYRPPALKDSLPEAVTQNLKWVIDGRRIKVTNPTGYFMNFNSITFNGIEVVDPTYVAPHSSASFSLPAEAGGNGTVTWLIISDYGGVGERHQAKI